MSVQDVGCMEGMHVLYTKSKCPQVAVGSIRVKLHMLACVVVYLPSAE